MGRLADVEGVEFSIAEEDAKRLGVANLAWIRDGSPFPAAMAVTNGVGKFAFGAVVGWIRAVDHGAEFCWRREWVKEGWKGGGNAPTWSII
jgi:hypothetical protein